MDKGNFSEAFKAALRSDFQVFAEKTFSSFFSQKDYEPNWHIEAVAHKLNQCASGQLRRLIILLPPRSLKSTLVSVAFPAFLLGHDPSKRIISASYSQALADKLSNETRSVLRTDWYRKTFPNTAISPLKDSQGEFETTAHGGRMATSVGGVMTGYGADVLIIDDPMKAQDAASEIERDKVKDWFDQTVSTRLNDPKASSIILVMQRLHIDDLAGHLIDKGGWDVLTIPLIAEEDQEYELGHGCSYQRKSGELLHPTRVGPDEVKEYRQNLGTAGFYAQYQQQPVPPAGNLFDWKWFKTYDTAPEFSELIMSVDVASTESGGNYTAVTVWGHRDNMWYFCASHRFQFDLPKVRQKICELDQKYQPDLVVIDEVGIGRGLKQELVFQGMTHVVGTSGKGKEVDAQEIAPMIEAGRVLVPHSAPGLSDFRDEIIRFPNGKYSDQVDSMVQLLRKRGAAVDRAQAHKRPERKHVKSKPNQLKSSLILIEAGPRRLFSYF